MGLVEALSWDCCGFVAGVEEEGEEEEVGEEGSWEAGSSFKRARMLFVSGEYSGSDIFKEEGCRQWERGRGRGREGSESNL